MGAMRRHDLTNKKKMTEKMTMTMTNIKTKTKIITMTFRVHPQRASLETCDL